ncbi:MAG: hypothetical protein SFZ23_01080 [Planctomycetota bacterium]|nr:hypothetical protein [Planctomycetota bacterium]
MSQGTPKKDATLEHLRASQDASLSALESLAAEVEDLLDDADAEEIEDYVRQRGQLVDELRASAESELRELGGSPALDESAARRRARMLALADRDELDRQRLAARLAAIRRELESLTASKRAVGAYGTARNDAGARFHDSQA